MSTRPNTQSELIAELSDPELLGALLNSVSSSYKKGRVTTVVERKKARYQMRLEFRPCLTNTVTMLGFEPPTRCRHSNTGSKRNIVPKHFPCSK